MSLNQTDNENDLLSALVTDIIDGEPLPEKFEDKYNLTVGKFLKFDIKTRILKTDKGYEILLLENKMDKTKALKEKTKKFLNTLI